jgi:adenosine deaminase
MNDQQRGLADLHRHLDGSLRPETVRELAAERGLDVPEDLPFFVGMGLQQALSRFAFTLSLLQEPEAVRRIADEMCDDATVEGVSTLEIRFAPQLHGGAPTDEIVDAALEGISGRAGLILCGLYGESPSVLAELVRLAKNRPGVVGIDLAGGPAEGHEYAMVDYATPFAQAKAMGLGRTVHAAEGRPPQEIRTAVENLHAQRIGHGTTLLEDERVVALLIEKQITVEACLTSNLHVGAISRLEDHAISTWVDRGIRACVCADNTLLSQTTAAAEMAAVSNLPDMTTEKIERLVEYGHEAAFTRAD